MAAGSGRSRALLVLLVLASITIITLDSRHGDSTSPVDPLRTGVASVIGPFEETAATALRPVIAIPGRFSDVQDLRTQNAALKAANAELATRLRVAAGNQARHAEVAGITDLADSSGFDVVHAQVVAIGPAQSFARTVTIDAGTGRGVVPDLTVINAQGLVGRVIAATRTTATVLLIVDTESTVGGRLGGSMELGFLEGDGSLDGDSTLEFSLVDHTVSPRVGDTVLTWGSRNGAPYLPGVPIGRVVSVHSSPAELTQTARVISYVDFSSLDVVGVVTDAGRSAKTNDLAQGGRR